MFLDYTYYPYDDNHFTDIKKHSNIMIASRFTGLLKNIEVTKLNLMNS